MNIKEIIEKLNNAQEKGVICINDVKIIFDKYDILYIDTRKQCIDFSCRYVENVSIDIDKIITIN